MSHERAQRAIGRTPAHVGQLSFLLSCDLNISPVFFSFSFAAAAFASSPRLCAAASFASLPRLCAAGALAFSHPDCLLLTRSHSTSVQWLLILLLA